MKKGNSGSYSYDNNLIFKGSMELRVAEIQHQVFSGEATCLFHNSIV